MGPRLRRRCGRRSRGHTPAPPDGLRTPRPSRAKQLVELDELASPDGMSPGILELGGWSSVMPRLMRPPRTRLLFMPRALQVAVCGPRHCTDYDRANAHEIGRLLAESGAVVLNGGGIGVMAAVSAGAQEAGGLVVGIRPGPDTKDANDDLDVVLATNIGEARNAVLVWSADVVIVVGGSWGTLSELALAKRRPVPVITIGGWQLLTEAGTPVPDAPPAAATPAEAVQFALEQRYV